MGIKGFWCRGCSKNVVDDCTFYCKVSENECLPIDKPAPADNKGVDELVYLACPYSHKDPAVMAYRVKMANIAAGQLMQSGSIVFSPISHSHPIAVDAAMDKTSHDFWLKQDMPWLRKCNRLVVLMLDGWEESYGVAQEIALARSIGITIDYLPAPMPYVPSIGSSVPVSEDRSTEGNLSSAAGQYEAFAADIGRLVDEKQAAYGDSFGKSGGVMRILYPSGIQPEQYDDALTVVRILDKLFRIATAKDALGESPYKDIAGYGLLGAIKH